MWLNDEVIYHNYKYLMLVHGNNDPIYIRELISPVTNLKRLTLIYKTFTKENSFRFEFEYAPVSMLKNLMHRAVEIMKQNDKRKEVNR